MSKKLRQEKILSILKKQGFATVKELVSLLDYSSATVNRDLNDMQLHGLVKRSYGGVEAIEKKFPPLPFRYDLMKKEKRHIGRRAAEEVADGEVIFIDASTTASYMGAYLTDKKNIRVITNNMQLAIDLVERGVAVTVLGGDVVENPSMLGGDTAVENAMRFSVDKVFFSTTAFAENGCIAEGGTYRLLHRVMMKNAKRIYYLADEGKRCAELKGQIDSFAEVSCVISDFDFSEKTRVAFPKTEFICVKE